MKNTFRTKILAKRTKAMMTKMVCKPIPRIGTPSEVSGRKDGMRSKKTVMARSIVVTKPILSPLSTGIRKLVRVKNISIILGMVR